MQRWRCCLCHNTIQPRTSTKMWSCCSSSSPSSSSSGSLGFFSFFLVPTKRLMDPAVDGLNHADVQHEKRLPFDLLYQCCCRWDTNNKKTCNKTTFNKQHVFMLTTSKQARRSKHKKRKLGSPFGSGFFPFLSGSLPPFVHSGRQNRRGQIADWIFSASYTRLCYVTAA